MWPFDYFRSPTPEESVVIFRSADPDIDIYAPSLVETSRLGLTDDASPNEDEQRTAFRGFVYRLVTDRANAISEALMHATVSRSNDGKEYEEVEDGHPWKVLFRNPNPDRSAFRFWKTTSMLRDLSKGAFHYVARGDRGIPESLYTIYPDFGKVDAVANTRGGIGGYAFWPSGSGEFTPIAPEDMIWLHYEHPVSPYEGASILQAAAYQSDMDLYYSIYGRDKVKTGNRPPFYISFKEQLAQAQIDSYQKTFKDKYMSIGSRGNVPILGAGGEIRSVGISHEDMQYVDASQMNMQDLAILFGFKPAQFKDSGVVANSSEVRRAWLQDSIQREVNELCADLTHYFKIIFNAMDSDLCIKPPDVVPKDRTEQARIDEIHIRSAIVTPDEVRVREGMDSKPEADVLFISGGLRPVEDMLNPQEPEIEEEPVL